MVGFRRSKTRMQPMAEGVFTCPACGTEGKFVQWGPTRGMLSMPVTPRGPEDEPYLECQTCKKRWTGSELPLEMRDDS